MVAQWMDATCPELDPLLPREGLSMERKDLRDLQ